MKFPIATAFSALALGLVWASNMPAQQRAEEGTVVTPADVLPVAEAKKRYLESQKHLDALAKGGGIAEITHHETDLEIAVVKPSRDQLQAAVAEAFDARRQLQQSELAELERRIASIKRALEIRDAMRDTIIDQRTDELLDRIQDGDGSGKRSGTPRYPGVKDTDGAAIPPAEDSSLDAQRNRRLKELERKEAELGVKDAEAGLASAKQAHDYAKKMHAKGYVTQADVGTKSAAIDRAKINLERARLQLQSLGGTPADGEPVTDKTPAEDPNAVESGARLFKLDVDEAKAKLDSAERAYERVKRLYASASVSQEVVDEQADKVKHAKLQLDRAVLNLDAFLEAHGRDRWSAEKPASGDAAETEKNQRLTALDVQEAEANLAAAKTKYERFKRHYEEKAIEQSLLDEQAEIYKRAQIQLERARVKLESLATPPKSDDRPAESTTTSLDRGPIDPERVVWGLPVGHLQLGYDVEPRKKTYAPGDVLTVALLIRNNGDRPIEYTSLSGEAFARMGLDLTLFTVDGEKIGWEWGPAHQDRTSLSRTRRFQGRFAPGGVYGLPRFKLSLGEPADAGISAELMAGLDVKAGQTARLGFTLASVDVGGDDTIELTTEPFEFRVEDRGQNDGGGRP